VPVGTNLLDAARQAGVELVAICGGEGICGECMIRPTAGSLSAPTLTEKAELAANDLAAGFRLACQAQVVGDVRIEIPPTSLTTPQRLQTEGQDAPDDFDPPLFVLDLQVDPPGLDDLRSDESRLRSALAKNRHPRITIERKVLAILPAILRQSAPDYRLRLVIRRNTETEHETKSLAAVLPANTKIYGLAVDVGTTKLAAYLVDLENGTTAARAGAMNPQISYGEDVISRIAYTNSHPDGAKTLQNSLVNSLNNLLDELCTEIDAGQPQIVEAVIVGNTCMHHLFAGLPVAQLGTAPYVAAVSDALLFPASDVGLKLSAGALVYMPPNIAGYVGADHIAMLIGARLKNPSQTTIALDIGTNTEISLFHNNLHWSCSCASGPAFEGAHITDGMRAAAGAIERLQIHGTEVQIKTISEQPATGICGSGILDTIAELRRHGLIDHRGVLKGQHPNLFLQKEKGGPHSAFILASADKTAIGRDIKVTRLDINEIQLAKAAIRTGVETLLSEAKITAEDIDTFLVAGAFGTYLDLDSAIRIGMFPDIGREKYEQIGNAAGSGARAMLVSLKQRQFAEQISLSVNYVELATNPAFHKLYIGSLAFP